MQFAKAVGVQNALQVSERCCYSNPCWTHLRSGDCIKSNNDGYGRVNCDFDVEEFEKLAGQQTVAASRLIWLTMFNVVKPSQLAANYRRNNHSDSREAPSQLVHRLIEAPWVPQKDGTFVRPRDAARELPEGFTFDESYEWLRKVHFGEANRRVIEEARAKGEEAHVKEAVAQELGFGNAATLERALQFATLPQDEQEWMLAESRRRQPHELPQHMPKNRERRAERVRRQAAAAPERIIEERMRSVSTGLDEVKTQAKEFLREQYTLDGDMYCQVCQARLPFKLDDGSWFFEAVEFLGDLKKHHHQNYLALCPNHAAMYQYANNSRASMQQMFSELDGDTVAVALGQQDMAIYFTETHVADLRAVIDAERAG